MPCMALSVITLVLYPLIVSFKKSQSSSKIAMVIVVGVWTTFSCQNTDGHSNKT